MAFKEEFDEYCKKYTAAVTSLKTEFCRLLKIGKKAEAKEITYKIYDCMYSNYQVINDMIEGARKVREDRPEVKEDMDRLEKKLVGYREIALKELNELGENISKIKDFA